MTNERDESDEKARAIVLLGRKRSIDENSYRGDTNLVEQYFQRLDAVDIDAALNHLRCDPDLDVQKETFKLLAAYFCWCWHVGKDKIGRVKVDTFVGQFAEIVALRLAGLGTRAKGASKFSLPVWATPDVAFGWRKPPHRPKDDNPSHLAFRVASFVALRRREGMAATPAKERAAIFFGTPSHARSVSWVEKQLTMIRSADDLQKYIETATKRELREAADEE